MDPLSRELNPRAGVHAGGLPARNKQIGGSQNARAARAATIEAPKTVKPVA